MTHDQMLAFVHRMTSLGLSHIPKMADGGTVLSGPQQAGQSSNTGARRGVGGFVSNLLGTTSDYQAQGAPIQAGTNAAQLNQAYQQAQQGLGRAAGAAGTLQPGIAAGAGIQGQLAGQLGQRAQGLGPNPAMAALNARTGQNIAQQAALAAGTRGAGANAGLIAQQAADVGSQAQQQAVAQGAIMQAQQEIEAQNQLGNLAQSQIGQGLQGVQLENQIAQGQQGILQGANTAFNQAQIQNQGQIDAINAATARANAEQNASTLGNIAGGIGSLGKAAASGLLKSVPIIGGLFAQGGEVPEHFKQMAQIYHPQMAYGGMAGYAQGGMPLQEGGQVPGTPKVSHNSYSNDTVQAMLSPGEVVIPLDVLKKEDKLGKMARFVAKEVERKKAGRKLV